jgi:hypothetical protein
MEPSKESTMKEDTLKVGDKVRWRGSWGMDAEQIVTVLGIDIDCGGTKYGTEVDEAPWSKIQGRDATLDLDSGHWAYGEQIEPLSRD